MALFFFAFPLLADDQPLTLEQAIELALTRNERVAAADERYAASEARVNRAIAFFFPEVSVSGTYLRYGSGVPEDSSRSVKSSTSELSAVLFDARAIPLFSQAKLLREASRLSAKQERRSLAYEAAGAYLVTLGLDAVRDAATRRREFARESLDDSRARFDAGLVSSNDVTRAELELANAELAESRAGADAEVAHINLGDLLVIAETPGLVVPSALLDSAEARVELDPARIDEARTRRLDLLAAESTVAAAREFAKEPLLRLVPTLDAKGTHYTLDTGGSAERTDDTTFSLVLSWDIFDGGEAFSERAERTALMRAAQLDLDRQSRGIDADVRTAATRLASEQASIRQAEQAVDAATKNSRESSALYREGLATALERSDAAVQLFESEVGQVRARFALAVAYLDLRASLGLDPLPARGDAPALPNQ